MKKEDNSLNGLGEVKKVRKVYITSGGIRPLLIVTITKNKMFGGTYMRKLCEEYEVKIFYFST